MASSREQAVQTEHRAQKAENHAEVKDYIDVDLNRTIPDRSLLLLILAFNTFKTHRISGSRKTHLSIQ